MFTDSYRKTANSLWNIVFRIEGNILIAVLPFCIVNCMLLGFVALLREHHELGFSATGHGLLTLLVSFLVISKVNLAYDRFRDARKQAGDAFLELRELMQLVIAISAADSQTDLLLPKNPEGDRAKEMRYWRSECASKVTDLMDATTRVLQDRKLACHFARNAPLTKPTAAAAARTAFTEGDGKHLHHHPTEENMSALDPMVHVQTLRMLLYCTSDLGIQLLERVTLVNKLQEFIRSYNNLLVLASTPLPFPLVQMARAFLFFWTFSMPFVLLGGPFSNLWTAQLFLFFLTYGFIGLELVSIKLSDPFGDSRDEVQLSNIRNATVVGMEVDLKDIQSQMTVSERRLQFSRQKQQQQKHDPSQSEYHGHDQAYGYHAMGENSADYGY